MEFDLWPDPNSSILASIDFGVPISDLLEWLKIRDLFFADNNRVQVVDGWSMEHALKLASTCKHPEAKWLSDMFKLKNKVANVQEAREVFLSHQNDPKAEFYSWFIFQKQQMRFQRDMVSKVAVSVPLAAATFANYVRSAEDTFHFAAIACAGKERSGYYVMGMCYLRGTGCGVDLARARTLLRIAAELGSTNAANAYGLSFAHSDPWSWFWRGRAACAGCDMDFDSGLLDQLKDGNPDVVFSIGRAFKGHIDRSRRRCFGEFDFIDFEDENFDLIVGPATEAVQFYELEVKATRDRIREWTRVGIRCNIVKDVRIMIGKMIWGAKMMKMGYEGKMNWGEGGGGERKK